MNRRRVIFLGDSITAGYGLERTECRYSSVFCHMLGWEEVNYGMTAALIARAGLSRTNKRAFVDRYKEMAMGDLVVVFGGTNDYWWSDTGIGSEASADAAEFRCAVRLLCSGLKEKYRNTPVVFITPYPHRGYGNFLGGGDFMEAKMHTTEEPNYLGNTLEPYCMLQREICAQYEIPVLDLYHGLEIDIPGNDRDCRNYTMDGCHPTEAGHRLIAQKLYDWAVKTY